MSTEMPADCVTMRDSVTRLTPSFTQLFPKDFPGVRGVVHACHVRIRYVCFRYQVHKLINACPLCIVLGPYMGREIGLKR
jgi:hypothetical protein